MAIDRKRTFWDPPNRRNRVWQTDFTEFETRSGGTWRILPVIDYATKLCLAAAVSGTSGARDAIHGLEAALTRAAELLGHPLLDDCTDPVTGDVSPVVIVTDNGPAFKSDAFRHFIARHPELRHVRTRHHAPETNGVVERFNQSLKYEQLYREEIADVLALEDAITTYLELYNVVRPHEAIGWLPPQARYRIPPPDRFTETRRPNLSEADSVQKS